MNSLRFLYGIMCIGLTAGIQAPAVLPARETPVPAPRPELDHVVVGWYRPVLSESDMKDVNAAIHVWLKNIVSDIISIESRIYEDVPSIIEAVRTRRVHWLNLSPLAYFQMSAEIDLARDFRLMYAAQMYGEGKVRRYKVIVRDDTSYETMRDLRQKKFATKEYNETARLYLNTLLLEAGVRNTGRFFAGIDEKQRYSQVVLGVFFKQYDAGIVPDGFLKIIGELNPQINRRLRVMATSAPYAHAIGLLSKAIDDETTELIMDTLLNLGNTIEGQQILNLFKLDGITTVEPEELQSVRVLLREYMALTDRIGP